MSGREIARVFHVNEATIRQWCDPTSDSHPAAGDIDAMPVSVRKAYYAIKLARMEAAEQASAEQARRVKEASAALTVAIESGTGVAEAAVRLARIAKEVAR